MEDLYSIQNNSKMQKTDTPITAVANEKAAEVKEAVDEKIYPKCEVAMTENG